MDSSSPTGSICEPCMPSEYYEMSEVCTTETYNNAGVRSCEFKCFGVGGADIESDTDDGEYLSATGFLIVFTLYLVIM